MTIKEVEQKLGVPRATIRFYEKQNLIKPEREDNVYRNYSDEDVAVLKKVIIFRKLGLSVQEIKTLFEDGSLLSVSMERNMDSLEKQIEELNGAMELCRRIREKEENLETFDEEVYWEEIHKEETSGRRFLDIAGDFIKYEKEEVTAKLRVEEGENQFRYSKRNVSVKAIVLILVCGVMVCILENFRAVSFGKGIFAPILFLLILTIFEIPAFLCKDKSPKVEKWLGTIGFIIALFGMVSYILAFFGNIWRELFIEAMGNMEFLIQILVGFGITLWGFVYYVLERRLIFDRRHVTGVNGFVVVVAGGLISAGCLYMYSIEACVSYILLLIIIYQTITHFVEEKQYSEEEIFKWPD